MEDEESVPWMEPAGMEVAIWWVRIPSVELGQLARSFLIIG
jgi:hypothetical protein